MFQTMTFFLSKDDDVQVSYGHFIGNIKEFRNEVKKTKECLMIADLMGEHFKNNETPRHSGRYPWG